MTSYHPIILRTPQHRANDSKAIPCGRMSKHMESSRKRIPCQHGSRWSDKVDFSKPRRQFRIFGLLFDILSRSNLRIEQFFLREA